MDFHDQLLEGYDEVDEKLGEGGGVIPAGWYYAKVAKVLQKASSKNGVPYVRLQLQILEGAQAGRAAFVSLSIGASPLKSDGVQRTQEEFADVKAKQQAMMKRWLRALRVVPGSPVGEGEDKVFNFFNVDMWEARDFIARIKVRPETDEYDASNQLADFKAVDDPKKGLMWLRSKGAPQAQTV